jgi:hypothetical protein
MAEHHNIITGYDEFKFIPYSNITDLLNYVLMSG